MPPKTQAAAPVHSGGKFVKVTDAVADDRNWIGRIQNELNCTAAWGRDWGFLKGGSKNLSMDMATKLYTIDDEIKMKEEELRKKSENKKTNSTSYEEYGKGENIEIFFDKNNNFTKHGDLKPEDRRLPKEWKKKKWEPPEDPFDPLKDMFKKKK